MSKRPWRPLSHNRLSEIIAETEQEHSSGACSADEEYRMAREIELNRAHRTGPITRTLTDELVRGIKEDRAAMLIRLTALYEACKDAFDHATADPLARLDQPQLAKLRAALAKAEGGAQ